MKLYNKPMMLGIAFLTALPLTACQTPSVGSSSVIIAETATDLEAEIARRYCEALKPEQITPADYDASPEPIRIALARNAASWVRVCQR